VLNEIGNMLHSAVRETDILGRFGGDEFLAILPNTPVKGGVLVGQRIRETVRGMQLEVDGRPLDLDISIGISGIQCGEVDDRYRGLRLDYEFFQQVIEMLISQADGLMYRAKQKHTTAVAHGMPITWNNLLQRLLPLEEE
jgi:diguanylate cyclase (GGDEF)-like protein